MNSAWALDPSAGKFSDGGSESLPICWVNARQTCRGQACRLEPRGANHQAGLSLVNPSHIHPDLFSPPKSRLFLPSGQGGNAHQRKDGPFPPQETAFYSGSH
jgi:hypothetical protein